jgi:hypothetical protein
MVESSK